MQPTKPLEDVIRALMEVLSQERLDLMAGKYSNIPAYAKVKSDNLSQLDSYLSGADAKAIFAAHKRKIQGLQRFAAENEKIILAAKHGVKSAQERLDHIDSIESNVGTYTEYGDQLRMHQTSTTCKKIA